jgi:hypothetical protein
LKSRHLWTVLSLLAIVPLTSAACQSHPKPAVMYRGGAQPRPSWMTPSILADLRALCPGHPNRRGRMALRDRESVQSPAIGDDGTIYFGSKDPALYAVDAQTGELRWRNDTSPVEAAGVPNPSHIVGPRTPEPRLRLVRPKKISDHPQTRKER